MVIAANKNKDKDKGILTEFNFPYTVEAFRLQSRYRFARESFSSENKLYKNNRDNRAGEIKLKKGRGSKRGEEENRKREKGPSSQPPPPPPFFPFSQSPTPFDACYAGVNNWGLE